MRTVKRFSLIAAIAAALAMGFWWLVPAESALKQASTWQRLAAPGPLSQAHAFLENRCDACHTPLRGVEAVNCIVCHANDQGLLQRQPTAFHASVGSCRECHREHRGPEQLPTEMDHTTLAKIGLRQLDDGPPPDSEGQSARLMQWTGRQRGVSPLSNPRIGAEEAILNCASCHATKDRHFGLFGNDCAQCHGTEAWSIPEYRHPSPSSTDCSQCHQAPPSHYMEHFTMISMKVAGQHHAQVDQCHLCHHTTSWNDIKGVGWYKHH
jgi:hypothetical protein